MHGASIFIVIFVVAKNFFVLQYLYKLQVKVSDYGKLAT